MKAASGNRQAVALVLFFRGSDFVRLFSKKPNKIATSKEKTSNILVAESQDEEL